MSIHHLPSDPHSAALAGAVAQIDRAFAGRKGPPARHAPLFVGSPPCQPERVSEYRRTTNLARVENFVRGHIEIAAGKSPAAADAHLLAWATSLKDDMARLGANCPPHLSGLTSLDLANARDELLAALSREAA